MSEIQEPNLGANQEPVREEIRSFRDKYRFLSNFFPAKVLFEGDIYPSVEHAYQSAKTLNPDERQAIRQVKLAGMAKQLGKHVTLRSDWRQINLNIMKVLVREKFQDLVLKEKLLNTGDAILIEGNNWGDTYWGNYNGEGHNHLGRILMEVREELKLQEETIKLKEK